MGTISAIRSSGNNVYIIATWDKSDVDAMYELDEARERLGGGLSTAPPKEMIPSTPEARHLFGSTRA
jgi:hypothetical protein